MTQWINNAGSGKSDWIAAANGAEVRRVSMDFTPLNSGEEQALLAGGGEVAVLANPHPEAVVPIIDPKPSVEEQKQCDASCKKLVGMFIYISLTSSGAGCDGYGVDFDLSPKNWRFGPYDENEDYDDYDTDSRVRLNER